MINDALDSLDADELERYAGLARPAMGAAGLHGAHVGVMAAEPELWLSCASWSSASAIRTRRMVASGKHESSVIR